jgi:hypothetical protein
MKDLRSKTNRKKPNFSQHRQGKDGGTEGIRRRLELAVDDELWQLPKFGRCSSLTENFLRCSLNIKALSTHGAGFFIPSTSGKIS